jgi:hypothetical protein
MARSKGDPRVLFAMNLILSTLFAWVVISGLAFVGVVEFSWSTVAVAAAALVLLTRLVVR